MNRTGWDLHSTLALTNGSRPLWPSRGQLALGRQCNQRMPSFAGEHPMPMETPGWCLHSALSSTFCIRRTDSTRYTYSLCLFVIFFFYGFLIRNIVAFDIAKGKEAKDKKLATLEEGAKVYAKASSIDESVASVHYDLGINLYYRARVHVTHLPISNDSPGNRQQSTCERYLLTFGYYQIRYSQKIAFSGCGRIEESHSHG